MMQIKSASSYFLKSTSRRLEKNQTLIPRIQEMKEQLRKISLIMQRVPWKLYLALS
jgi:hypothetical protein